MKLIDLYPYLTNGQKLLVRVPINANTDEIFEVEVIRDQSFETWLESSDLEIDEIFDSGNLMITCKPKRIAK